MPISTIAGAPTRFLQGQSGSDTRNLALDIFGGEVLTAFDLATITLDKVQTRQLSGGARSARFPKTWKATAGYHAAGQEMLGDPIATGEISISVDDILVSHVSIYDLDEMLSHFEVRSQFSTELGRGLSRVYDKNNFRQMILAARTAAVGPFPGGTVIASDTLKATAGVFDGVAWITQIRAANLALFNKDVPEDQPRYLTVQKAIFDAIKWAKDSNGNYLVLNRFLNTGTDAGGITQRGDALEIDGVIVMPSRNLPNTNETSDTTVYSKYRADYSKTLGVLWTPMATATVKMKDISLEQERDTRRLENFMVANMLVGHGTLRPECAVEFAAVT
jgi:hypothetical protein